MTTLSELTSTDPAALSDASATGQAAASMGRGSDAAAVVLDLPPPVSVNKLRQIDWHGAKRAKNWRKVANGYLLMVKARPTRIPRFEILLVLDEATVRCDADNAIKMVVDYLRLVEIIENDSPKHMRRVTVEWGEAPLGCRVTVKPCA